MKRAEATPAWAKCLAVGFSMLLLSAASAGGEISLLSPDQRIELTVSGDSRGQLSYRVLRAKCPVMETSKLGLTVDGRALGLGVALGTPARSTIREHHAWRGVKSQGLTTKGDAHDAGNCQKNCIPCA